MCNIKFSADDNLESERIRFDNHMEMDISTRNGRIMVQVDKQPDGEYTFFLNRYDGKNWIAMGSADMGNLEDVELD